MRFQSTLPRRERLVPSIDAAPTGIFQSTLPRRERRKTIQINKQDSHFNPRSREGSDNAAMSGIQVMLFQSTLPRRERLDLWTCRIVIYKISIHAPAKGATPCLLPKPPCWNYFNPRSREGSDSRRSAGWPLHLQFQSTLPRRERRCSVALQL